MYYNFLNCQNLDSQFDIVKTSRLHLIQPHVICKASQIVVLSPYTFSGFDREAKVNKDKHLRSRVRKFPAQEGYKGALTSLYWKTRDKWIAEIHHAYLRAQSIIIVFPIQFMIL